MLFDWCKCKSFAYSQTQKIGKGPFISNFNLLAHLLGWKWAITRNSTHEVLGQISRSPKGTKSKCYIIYFITLFNPITNYCFCYLIGNPQSIQDFFSQLRKSVSLFFNSLFDKNCPCKRGIKIHCFCSLVQEGEHAFHVFTVKRIYK